ncbi:phosphoribosylpyrophosphate synthetase [Chitinophaga sp. Cy-1792]|uniref:phosphoribosylpyrophosphate synthetase n=1 Tax=Chitinophaga sp. Cy-1792 TaxID=2608339 RepID=UPI00141ED445|nr:phosphoribosylpyrophosphate synthetase [Chitinophaga sp. Cy-1792]NIG56267.1 phosphoribosylpyrophosphate synthetase [Chitinophaga sp. Cy-1792]
MKTYETVTEALQDLRQRGFTRDFNMQFDCIQGADNNYKLHPQDFEIEETYRFEGNTNPADEDIVYAISAKDGTKGVLMHGYGVYSEDISADMIRKLGTK